MFKAALAAKGVGASEDEEHPDVEAVEWCESLTQGHAPQGSYEISAKGPRCDGLDAGGGSWVGSVQLGT
jgi:hypothetical protein